MPVWYRRRWQNIARKSGNVEDFVTRWGGRYDHMIVLDADSLIDAPTLLTLVRMMQADPALGICRPRRSSSARTFFGRLQQFAACVYGPVITRGLAAWSGDSGNYWGHNAIIRMSAFAAELRTAAELKGRKPFGGHILSHDFVEAALMRRGGYKVRMADCGGSWEESPPSLIDVAIRDRRWAQGNLQHMKIVGTAGLSFTSRLHLGIGIMSYLSSPLWLLMLASASRSRHAVAPDTARIFQSRFPAVSDLAALRRRADDDLVLVQHDRADDSEDAGADPRAAVAPHPARLRRRHRRDRQLLSGDRAVRAVCAHSDAGAEPPCVRGVHGPRFGLEAAAPRRRRHLVDRRLAFPQAAHALLHDRRSSSISCRPRCSLWVSPALLGLFLSVPLSRASGSESLGRPALKVRVAAHARGTRATGAGVAAPRADRSGRRLPEDGLRYLARNREARLAHIDGNLPRPRDPRGGPTRMPSPPNKS